MTLDELGTVLLAGSVVLLAAIFAVRLSVRTGLPSLLIYLALGLVIGERGLGLDFDDQALTGVLGYAALVLILAEGGLTTRWSRIRPSVLPAAALSTVGTVVSIGVVAAAAHYALGTVVSIGVVAAAAHYALGFEWTLALLVGAVVSSTDAAAVFSVLRGLPLPPRLVGMLEAESGFNDAPVVIAVVSLTELAAAETGGHGEAHPWWLLLLEAVGELAIGAVVGLLVGRLGAEALRRVALPASGLYPIAVIALVVSAYGAADVLHGSGFLATYVAGLALGNVRLPHGAAVRGFAEGLGWLAQIGLFVLLGLLADPFRLDEAVVPALGVGLALLLLARPLSVLASVTWFRIPLREQAFLSWAGLRGAVPVVLATVPATAGLPGATKIFDLVFVLVVVFTLVQGPTLPWVARRLQLSDDVISVDLDVESSPLGALDADVVQLRIGPTSKLHGVEIFELRLPDRCNITLVVRDGEPFVPTPRTMLRHGDELILVAAANVREVAERRLREVSVAGKLAGWYKRLGYDVARRGRRPPAAQR